MRLPISVSENITNLKAKIEKILNKAMFSQEFMQDNEHNCIDQVSEANIHWQGVRFVDGCSEEHKSEQDSGPSLRKNSVVVQRALFFRTFITSDCKLSIYQKIIVQSLSIRACKDIDLGEYNTTYKFHNSAPDFLIKF